MSENKEKRMIASTGYEFVMSTHIGYSEILVGENMSEPEGNYYFIANYKEHGIIGEYFGSQASGDYLEIMREFATRMNTQIEAVSAEISAAEYQAELIAPESVR